MTVSDRLARIRSEARPLAEDDRCEDIAAWIGDASIVLLGEATHGTHEFYWIRAHLTKTLIESCGFSAVAIEGDWPDAYEVNRFVQQEVRAANDAAGALSKFRRFPTWMWRNTSVAEFVGWLHSHNRGIARPDRRAGFYGLDLYSLHASMRAVVGYLEERDPEAARAARASYSCFDRFGPEAEAYSWASGRLGSESCEDAVTRELLALHGRRHDLLIQDGGAAADDFFNAEQNALLARNAERYYRAMANNRISTWNVRDEHMAETLDRLLEHLERRGQPPKVVVWAHNSHVGDARATDMGDAGELNIGQLARQRHGSAVKAIGFSTYSGTVRAASDWGERAEVMRVRPAVDGSYEDLFHEAKLPSFFLPVAKGSAAGSAVADTRLERAIGVIYRPETERASHYFGARLSEQFDAIIHVDDTNAVDALEEVQRVPEDVPETFPTGI